MDEDAFMEDQLVAMYGPDWARILAEEYAMDQASAGREHGPRSAQPLDAIG
jgi:hypothetical protein